MLFQKRFWPGIAEGTITVAFRRWKRLQVVPGNRYRTPGGMIEVEAVAVVDPLAISEADAMAAGHASRTELLASLAPSESLPTYRIDFTVCRAPTLATSWPREPTSPPPIVPLFPGRWRGWTGPARAAPGRAQSWKLVASNPAVRAGDLSPRAGMDLLPFKLNVRKLKNLGLTLSLGTGYRLSPRGEAFLAEDKGDD
ncbi:MAG: hypothetical protein WEC33_04450 [Dehalococcoidia bacterium]